MRKILIAAAALAVISSSAQAGNNASATADASATVVQAIGIKKANDLNFGSFTVEGAGSVSSSGEYISTTKVPGSQTTPEHAAFNVDGEPTFSYTVGLPSGGVNLQGALTSQVLNASLEVLDGNTTRTLDAAGDDSFQVKGTLSVADSQSADNYSGSFNVTVTYE